MTTNNLTTQERSEYLYNIGNYIKLFEKSDFSLQLDEYYKFNTSFAISKAELSQLTEEEAYAIFQNNYTNYLLDEDSERFIQDFMNEFNEIVNSQGFSYKIHKIQKLHDKLEYNNIVNAMKYTDIEKNPNIYNYILENGITKELLIKLHNILTYKMDALFLDKGVAHYSPYFSGEIRKEDNIKVGERAVGLAKDIDDKIELIRQKSLNIQNIFDVFEIHGIMYEAHIFNNGNKRISRIIESLLINIYNFAPSLPISYGYYIYNDFYINSLVSLVIEKKDFEKWADFSYASTLLVALEIMSQILETKKYEFFEKYQLQDIAAAIPLKEDFQIQELEKKLKKAKGVYFTVNEIIDRLYNSGVLEVREFYDNESNKTKQLYIVRYDLLGEKYQTLVSKYEDVYKTIISYNTHFASKFHKYTINQYLKDYRREAEMHGR